MLAHEDYSVGWISALPLEMRAARAVLDETHPHLPQRPTDSNSYILGTISGHNTVIACLPYGVYGTTSAASVLTNMMATFPNLEFALMVGIGGGVPGSVDVRLGDVVVSKPTGAYGGVVQYDYGKVVSGQRFQHTGSMNQPPQVLLTSMAQLQAEQLAATATATAEKETLQQVVSRAFEQSPELERGFASPGLEQDQLFAADYRHVESQETCSLCDRSRTVNRNERDSEDPYVHYGLIASGNQVMKDAEIRDQLAKKFDIICFEMEAAGLMNQIPCLVIRGICDYSDSHKNKTWQGYAALTAAAYARLLLSVVPVHSRAPIKKKELTAAEKACLRALVLTDPAEDLNSLKRRRGERVPGTCSWMIETDEIRQWLGLVPLKESELGRKDKSSDVLWVFGNPGTGKSTIATAIAEELPKQPVFQKNNERTLAFFFCDSTIEERRTAPAILRGLLYQLIQQRPELIEFVHSKYEERGDKIFTSFDALWGALLQIGRHSATGEKYLLIDALDECEPESQDILLAQISQSFDSERKSNCGIHFLITSRPYPETGRYLGDFAHKNLASYPKVERDLHMFINRRLGEISKKNRYPENITKEVSKVLQDKAEGTFLWVGIACTELLHVRSRDAIRRLKALPQGLHSLYKNLLDTAFDNDEDNESILQMLSFIATARRALTVAELADACERYNDEDDEESRLVFTREDIEMCRLMIVVENGSVRLLHKSVKDFLLSARGGTLLDELKVHATLAYRCISHLVAQTPKDSFLDYAVLHWPDHAVLAGHAFTIGPDQKGFFDLSSEQREQWLNMYRRLRIFSGIPDGFSILHVAARWGIEEVTRFALDSIRSRAGNNIYQDDDFTAKNAGTPLQEAARRGNIAVLAMISNARPPGSVLHEKILTAAASNETNGDEALSVLLKGPEKNTIEISGAVMYAAAANRGRGTAILSLLLQHNIIGFQASDFIKSAAKNRTDGKEMVRILLSEGRHKLAIGPEAIACLFMSFDVEIIQQLIKCQGSLALTKTSFVAALSLNHQHGQQVMAFLMNREVNHIHILAGFLAMEYQQWRRAARLLKAAFHPVTRKIRFQKETALAATENQVVGEELLEILLDLPADDFSVDPDAFLELCRSFESQIVQRLFEHGNQQVIEAVMEAACSNPKHAEPLVVFFLKHMDKAGMEFTASIATVVMTNSRHNRFLLRHLLGHPHIRLTWQGASKVVEYADDDTVRWMFRSQAGDPALTVTAQTVSDAVRAHQKSEMLTLLMAPPNLLNLDITDSAVARFFEIYDESDVDAFIRLRGYRIFLTVRAINAVCKRFGFQTISLLLDEQRSRGPLQQIEVWIKALQLNTKISPHAALLIFDDLVAERMVRDDRKPKSTLGMGSANEQDKWAWEEGPEAENEKTTLQGLPLEVMCRVALSLSYCDYVNTSRVCRKLYVRLRNESLAQIVVKKDLAHLQPGRLVKEPAGRVNSWKTIGVSHDITQAWETGRPYAAITLAKAKQFVYNEECLVYLWQDDIRVLLVHSLAPVERVITIPRLLPDILDSPAAMDYDIKLIYYAQGVLSIELSSSEMEEKLLVSLSIPTSSSQKPRAVFVHPLHSAEGLFVRNDESHSYYGFYDRDSLKWEIRCVDLKTGDIVNQEPLLLDGRGLSGIGAPPIASFALYGGHLYALIPQNTILDESKQSISLHAWTCLSPVTTQKEIFLRRVWRPRGRHSTGASRSDASLYFEQQTGRPCILECIPRVKADERAWAGCFRHPLPSPDETTGGSNDLVSVDGGGKDTWEVVPFHNEGADDMNDFAVQSQPHIDKPDMSHAKSPGLMPVFSAYHPSTSALIELLTHHPKRTDDDHVKETLYLRTTSLPQIVPVLNIKGAGPDPQGCSVSPAESIHSARATHWPSESAPPILRSLLLPPGYDPGKISGFLDDRCILYSVGHPETSEQQIVLLSFDPGLGYPGLRRLADLGPTREFPPLPAALSMVHGPEGSGGKHVSQDLAALVPAVRNEIPMYMHMNRGLWLR
ncbi:hypothetical protein BJX64DRAFT_293534 [Aspergillus heterothallicus]